MEEQESRMSREEEPMSTCVFGTMIDLVEDSRGIKNKTHLPESPL